MQDKQLLFEARQQHNQAATPTQSLQNTITEARAHNMAFQ